MSDSPQPRDHDTIARRLEKYERFVRLDAYLGGALGGLALFGDLAKDSFHDAGAPLRATFITLAMVTALTIGTAFSGFEWAQTVLKRKLVDTKSAEHDLIGAVGPDGWPWSAWLAQRFAPILLGLTGISLVVATWWSNEGIRRTVARARAALDGQVMSALVVLWVLLGLVVACVVIWGFVRLAKGERKKPDHGLVLESLAVVIASDLKHFGRIGSVKSLTLDSDGFDFGLKFPDDVTVYGFPGNAVTPVLESGVDGLPQFQQAADNSLKRLPAPGARKRASRRAAT